MPVKLSVMMITYNHERFIAQALASALAQRVNFDYEIVVGEDCSTDRTRAVLMDFHRRYPRRIVPLLRDQNMGIMRNLEATLRVCQGQYLAWLEGDDFWTCEDKLQRQIDFLDAHPDYAICCHRVRAVDEMDSGWTGTYPTRAAGPYTLDDLLDANWIVSCSVVYRWGSIHALPSWFLEMKLGDWPLHVLVARSGKIQLLDEVMSVYRVHSGGTWSSRSTITQLHEINRMLTALDEHLGFRYTNAIHRTLARSYRDMASLARLAGNRIETGKHLVSCLRNGGLTLPDSPRHLSGLAAYILIGSWYKVFSKAKWASQSRIRACEKD